MARGTVRCARLVPVLVALVLGATTIAGSDGCGRSFFSLASNTPTGSPTASPGTGNFVYASNTNDGKISAFSRNVNTGALTLVGTVKAGSGGLTGLAITADDG